MTNEKMIELAYIGAYTDWITEAKIAIERFEEGYTTMPPHILRKILEKTRVLEQTADMYIDRNTER